MTSLPSLTKHLQEKARREFDEMTRGNKTFDANKGELREQLKKYQDYLISETASAVLKAVEKEAQNPDTSRSDFLTRLKEFREEITSPKDIELRLGGGAGAYKSSGGGGAGSNGRVTDY